MDKRANKSVLRSGGSPKMPVKAVAESVAVEAAHAPQRTISAVVCVSMDQAEAKRKFDAWRVKYEPIAREIYEKRRERAESKRRRAIARKRAFGDLCEMTDGLASFCRGNGISLTEGERMLNPFRPAPHAAVFVLFFEIAWIGAVFLRKELTRRIDRAKHEVLRPYYYEQEKARRQAMAKERRKISRRSTHNPCPTREEIVDAWKKVKDSNEDLLRFGSIMEDLECYIDNSLIRDDSGAIIGRRSGIKGWLQMEIPALYTVYSRVMAYKAAAKRMRQIIELQDPLPLSYVLDMGMAGNSKKNSIQDYSADEIQNEVLHTGKMGGNRVGKRSELIVKAVCKAQGKVSSEGVCNANGEAHGEVSQETQGEQREKVMGTMMSEAEEVAVLRARAIYLEVINPVGKGARRQTALIDRMMKLTNPDSIEDANMLGIWRQKYECKITVRTKSLWIRRLVKMQA